MQKGVKLNYENQVTHSKMVSLHVLFTKATQMPVFAVCSRLRLRAEFLILTFVFVCTA